jgi:hypothetical protein
MRKFVYIFICVALFSCSDALENEENNSVAITERTVFEDVKVDEVEDTSLILNNNLAEEDETIQSFLKFYDAFTTSISTKNEKAFNQFIYTNYGLYIIEAPGAMPVVSKIYNISKFKTINTTTKFFDLPFNEIKKQPLYEELPTIICDENSYNKLGCFVSENNTLKESQLWGYSGLNEKEIQAIEFLTKTIQITVVNTSNFTFYFSKIEDKWYLTFIDLRTPCTA